MAARHKTAHRKRMEKLERDNRKARAVLLSQASMDTTLKVNAARNAKRYK